MNKPWYCYIVQCKDGTLYTGVTTDLDRRIIEHNSSKKGAKYTRSRRPVVLMHYELFPDRSTSQKREYFIKKKLTRAEKFMLFETKD